MTVNNKKLRLLKYVGGKTRVLDQLYQYFPKHYTYIEPFGGSYVVLLNKIKSPIEAINDLDPGITALAYCYLFQREELELAVSNAISSQGLFEYFKDYEVDGNNMLELAMQKLYLVYMSFSGNMKHIGVRVNEVKEPFPVTPEMIAGVHQRLKKVQIFSEDYQQFLKRFLKTRKGFIYLDPPYVVSDSKQYYNHNFNTEMHIQLSDILHSFDPKRVKWLMSYDNHKLIEELYTNDFINQLYVPYSFQAPHSFKVDGKEELLISNYDIHSNYPRMSKTKDLRRMV